jgi:hypothetical protein
MTSPAFDRRREPRHPVLQIGTILADPSAAPRYCLILDRSKSGVRLRTTSDFQAPNEFFLRCMHAESKYKVVWRHGASVGAMVISSAQGSRRA